MKRLLADTAAVSTSTLWVAGIGTSSHSCIVSSALCSCAWALKGTLCWTKAFKLLDIDNHIRQSEVSDILQGRPEVVTEYVKTVLERIHLLNICKNEQSSENCSFIPQL